MLSARCYGMGVSIQPASRWIAQPASEITPAAPLSFIAADNSVSEPSHFGPTDIRGLP